jgi:IS1 family transposase
MVNRLSIYKQVLVISALVEGASIRGIERITGIHRDTIMRLGVRVGKACAKFMDQRLRKLPLSHIQVDEAWSYIQKKHHNRTPFDEPEHGDAWTYVAMDTDTKLVAAYLVGDRTSQNTVKLMKTLANRLSKRTQISTDCWTKYDVAIGGVFDRKVDYGKVHKVLAQPRHKYEPRRIISMQRIVVMGNPDKKKISTSHVEKLNHTLRMHNRRMTRMTNAFSKKLENFQASMSLTFAYYNFVKIHQTLRSTPAMAAGVVGSILTVKDLVIMAS